MLQNVHFYSCQVGYLDQLWRWLKKKQTKLTWKTILFLNGKQCAEHQNRDLSEDIC